MTDSETPRHYPKTAMFMRGDCVELSRTYLDDESIRLVISDPPFGIYETGLEKAYNRDSGIVVSSYEEAR